MSGLKDNKDKMQVELDWQFVEQMAKRMNENKDKYPRDNWKQPINIVELEDALIRHWFDYKRGDERENHLAAIALNAMMINYQKNSALSNDTQITLKDNWNNEKINEYLKQIIERKEYKEYYKNIYTNNYLHDNPNEFIGAPGTRNNNFVKPPSTGVMVDPPSGWKYGFPKVAPYPLPENMIEWVIEQGYPRAEVEGLGEHFYMQYSEIYE